MDVHVCILAKALAIVTDQQCHVAVRMRSHGSVVTQNLAGLKIVGLNAIDSQVPLSSECCSNFNLIIASTPTLSWQRQHQSRSALLSP